jgi:ATP-dependent Clp protease ATP-binding subunit ClpB
VLLQVLDDGRITDSRGRTVDFKNTILIMTSNIGAGKLLEGITADGEIPDTVRQEVLQELNGYFRPEFLNRLDETILFKPLTMQDIRQIIGLLMQDLNRRLYEKQITIRLTDAAMEYAVQESYNPLYGARPLKRYLQKEVETKAARLLLSQEIEPGSTLVLDKEGDGLAIHAEAL